MLPHAYKGKDGWFFYSGRRSKWLTYMTGGSKISPAAVLRWRGTLSKWSRQCSNCGATFRAFIVPEKHCVVEEKLPDDQRLARPTPLQTFETDYSESSYTRVPLKLLSAQPDAVFLKRDSHWSPFGALAAFRSLFPEFNRTDHLERQCRTQSFDEFDGDLFRSFSDCISDIDGHLLPSRAIKRRLGRPAEMGTVVTINNKSAKTSDSICVFGNSFFEYFLLNLFSFHFRDVTYFFSHKVDHVLVCRLKPTIVLFQTCERFLPASPKDDDVPLSTRFLFRHLLASSDRQTSSEELGVLGGGYRVAANMDSGCVREINNGSALHCDGMEEAICAVLLHRFGVLDHRLGDYAIGLDIVKRAEEIVEILYIEYELERFRRRSIEGAVRSDSSPPFSESGQFHLPDAGT